MKELEGLAKEHIYITHRQTTQCGDGQREEQAGAGRRWAKAGGRGRMGTPVIVSTIKSTVFFGL